MENENYPIFNVNDSDELNMQKLLNSTLVKELRKSKEENIKLKHEKEILNLKIEKLEEFCTTGPLDLSASYHKRTTV